MAAQPSSELPPTPPTLELVIAVRLTAANPSERQATPDTRRRQNVDPPAVSLMQRYLDMSG